MPYPTTWYDKNDNTPFDLTCDSPLNDRSRLIIVRRNGESIWAPHKCIRCGAPITRCIVWIREYEGRQLRLHEQCMACNRTTSWKYRGVRIGNEPLVRYTAFRHVRDTQRAKVYEWERTRVTRGLLPVTDTATPHATRKGRPSSPNRISMRSEMTMEECKCLVHRIFSAYGMPPPTIRAGNGRSSWMLRSDVMCLTPDGRNRWVIIHEASHALTHRINRTLTPIYQTEGAHGPTFVAVYCILLEQFGPFKAYRLWKHAKEEGGLSVARLSTTRQLLSQLTPSVPGDTQ